MRLNGWQRTPAGVGCYSRTFPSPEGDSMKPSAPRRLFNQVSYVCPVETLLRLRRGSDVLIKMPADGLGNVRE